MIAIRRFLQATILLVVSLRNFVEAGRVKVCAKTETTYQPISNADVHCWDDDYDSDDFMTSGTTGQDGCVTLSYKNKPTGWKCWRWWDSCASRQPDIYCEVSGTRDQCDTM